VRIMGGCIWPWIMSSDWILYSGVEPSDYATTVLVKSRVRNAHFSYDYLFLRN
jgi:hypothetical protein